MLCVRTLRSLAVEDPVGRVTDLTAPMVASPAEVRGPADWVLLAVKAHQTAGRPLEWEARNAVVRRLRARHGIPTPVSDVIVPLLAACGPLSPGSGAPAGR